MCDLTLIRARPSSYRADGTVTSLRDTCASSESQFDSRRTGRARRPQHAIRRAARGLKTAPQRPQERVAGERAIDADAPAGNTAEERVKRDRLVSPEKLDRPFSRAAGQ